MLEPSDTTEPNSSEAVAAEQNTNNNGAGRGEGTESRTNLIVNYLPPNVPKKEIIKLFSNIGGMETCKIMHDPITGSLLGYAFVKYKKPEYAKHAINTLNGFKIQNKTLKVSYARPRSSATIGANLHVSGLTVHVTEEDLKKLFSPYGNIISVRILQYHATGCSKGIGFVRFDQRFEAERALMELHGTAPDGFNSTISIKFANKMYCNNVNYQFPTTTYTTRTVQHRHVTRLSVHATTCSNCYYFSNMAYHQTGVNGTKRVIFIYNLSPNLDETFLWQLFCPFGAVETVNIIRDYRTKTSKGYGFVTMTNYCEAVRAVCSLDGYTVGDRVLQVRFKADKVFKETGQQNQAGVVPFCQ